MGKNDKQDKQGKTEGQPEDNARRRLLLRGGIVAGGVTAFAAGYGEVVFKAGKGLVTGSAGTVPAHATRGNALTPEFRIDPVTGVLSTQPGQVVSPSSCLGCWTQCGVRVRVDTQTNRILRIAGNPYHPLATTQPAPMDTPVREVYAMLGGENGLEGRATACARGSAMLEHQTSPHRVLQPLKRVGKRGEGRWETIAFEQLVKEICEGGDLFGEGPVEGLRAVYDPTTPVDPDNPEYGPKSNQLLVTDASNEGRGALLRRFAGPSFGTVNVANHGAYCGQSFRVGAAAALGGLPQMPHGKPDWKNASFGLFIGAAPAQSGNPFQRQGRELAEARARKENTFRYVVVSPILPTSSSLASGSGNRWIGVKPATDLALAMALIRWILDNERYDAAFLAQPSPAAMEAAGEASWSNATHLLINDPQHPRFGTYLRGADLGWPMPEAPAAAEGKEPAAAVDAYVVQRTDGSFAPHTEPLPAELFVERRVQAPGLAAAPGDAAPAIAVCTALSKLRTEARGKSMDDYAALCGIPTQQIEELAREFTSYGKRAVADAHGGTMSGSGFYTAYAISMLNTLVGNLNVQGGLVLDAGPFGPFGPGPRYNFADFAGKAKPHGVALSRTRFPYEKSSEYQRKKDAGTSPYPAKAPWYPAVGGLSSEMVASALAGYPYKAKVWINHMSNPVYSIAGFKNALGEALKDPKNLPLIVSIDPFMNETTALADYIVPDTVTYESWGISAPWADVIAKSSTVRWPAVEPAVARTATGAPVNVESFLFAVAERLELPGFGDQGMSDAEGNPCALKTAEDFFLRGLANMAFSGGKAVPAASDDDMLVTGVDAWQPRLKAHLKDAEWRQVAMLMTRGGRFDRIEAAWKGDHIRKAHAPALQVWMEDLAKMRHSMTGEPLSGCPTYFPTRMADGSAMRAHFPEDQWPMLMTSYKSNLMSSMSIGVARLRQVHPHNPVSINRQDAARLGVGNGDTVRLTTPGSSMLAVALVRDGMAPGAIAIEYGYGHTELGARTHTVDGKALPHNPQHGNGVNLNDLGFADPSRTPDQTNVWIDWVSGAVVRQGLPARIERV